MPRGRIELNFRLVLHNKPPQWRHARKSTGPDFIWLRFSDGHDCKGRVWRPHSLSGPGDKEGTVSDLARQDDNANSVCRYFESIRTWIGRDGVHCACGTASSYCLHRRQGCTQGNENPLGGNASSGQPASNSRVCLFREHHFSSGVRRVRIDEVPRSVPPGHSCFLFLLLTNVSLRGSSERRSNARMTMAHRSALDKY